MARTEEGLTGDCQAQPHSHAFSRFCVLIDGQATRCTGEPEKRGRSGIGTDLSSPCPDFAQTNMQSKAVSLFPWVS